MTSRDTDSHFETLLEHAPFLRRLARGLVRDGARAEDLVQETWAVALQRPPNDPRTARGWLATVARRLSRDHSKQDRRRRAREAGSARGAAGEAPSGRE